MTGKWQYRLGLTLMLAQALAIPVMAQHQNPQFPFVGNTLEGSQCSGRYGGVGPWDYQQRFDPFISGRLKTVESAHFKPEMESLEHQNTLGNLYYTLRAFPNHPRALVAISRFYSLSPALQRDRSSGEERIPPECWFQRAAAFRPNDLQVQAQYAVYLHKKKAYDKAEDAYRNVLETQPGQAEIRYNYGLLLLDMGRPEEAREQARITYEAGHPLPGLRRQLERAGYPLE